MCNTHVEQYHVYYVTRLIQRALLARTLAETLILCLEGYSYRVFISII